MTSTHEVFNQSPPFADVNLFASDLSLQEAVVREGGGQVSSELMQLGAELGSRESFERGRLANEVLPRLKTHDRHGRRLDIVEFHPAYHEAMAASCSAGVHCSVWEHLATPGTAPRPGANVARGAAFYMTAQAESGHCCPITMTSAAVPSLMLEPALAREWLPRILTRAYDPRFLPAAEKSGVTIGMGMTEKQGGTDVRANTSRAVPASPGGAGGTYLVTGHKWFLSAPMCDAFLMLAQAPGGLSCFLVPRFRPDGSVNALHLQRLKDKLGNRSNASTEVELHEAHAHLVGPEGRGVSAIIEMVTSTRLDCALASAALMRFALAAAIHHCEHRTVFQRKLVDQPLMSAVLADLALDVEAAVALAFRLARAFDWTSDERASAWRRLMTPVTKYFVCKIAPPLVAEAMECLGGNGYVEDAGLARVFREAPVNAIWEGSGNVMALDVLRVLQKEPEVAEIVLEELAQAAAGDPHLEAAYRLLEHILHEPRLLDRSARTLVELLAKLAAGTILRAHAPSALADAYVATRLSGPARSTYGQGLERADVRAILARATPSR